MTTQTNGWDWLTDVDDVDAMVRLVTAYCRRSLELPEPIPSISDDTLLALGETLEDIANVFLRAADGISAEMRRRRASHL